MALHITNGQRAEVLTQALPYIQKYYGKSIVVKYGGNAMINETLKEQVMEDIVLLHLIGVKIVLVHGGGPEITDMLKKIGKESVFLNGLRVTDKETADVVQMVLAGKINKSLVNLLQINGGNAIGLSGLDGHMIEAEMKDEALGYVGKITKVDVKPITDLLEKNYIPVVSTIGCDDKGNVYIVTGQSDYYAFVCDGKNKTLEKPKKKKIKHLADTGEYVDLSIYSPLYDAHIKKELKSLLKKGGCYLG